MSKKYEETPRQKLTRLTRRVIDKYKLKGEIMNASHVATDLCQMIETSNDRDRPAMMSILFHDGAHQWVQKVMGAYGITRRTAADDEEEEEQVDPDKAQAAADAKAKFRQTLLSLDDLPEADARIVAKLQEEYELRAARTKTEYVEIIEASAAELDEMVGLRQTQITTMTNENALMKRLAIQRKKRLGYNVRPTKKKP